MELLAIILGVFFTLAVFSILFKDNPFYKGAEAILIGYSAGHLIVMWFARAWQLGFVPLGNQFAELFTTPWENTRIIAMVLLGCAVLFAILAKFIRSLPWLVKALSVVIFLCLVIGAYLLLPMLIPVMLGLLFYSRFIHPVAWMVRLPISFFFGFAGSLSVVMALDASIWRQLAATVSPFFIPDSSFVTFGGLLSVPIINVDGLIILLGTITALAYFFMTREHKGALGSAATAGRYFIMIALGAKFGAVTLSYISLLYERLLFLYNSADYLLHSVF